MSPRWMEVLGVTVSEAGRLGMGIDMTTGTGWNFGGPNITSELSCLRLDKKNLDVAAGRKPDRLGNRADVLAVLAESNDSTVLDLTDKLTAEGDVDWTAPGSGWRLSLVKIQRGQPEVERAAPGGEGPLRKAKVGRGRVFLGEVEAALLAAGLRRETLTDLVGLGFVRRTDSDAHIYYLLNKSPSAFNGWVPLAVKDRAAALLDPMTSQTGLAASRVRNGQLEVFVQLQPGQALFVRTEKRSFGKLPPWTYRKTAGAAAELAGNWKVEFILGGPELPPVLTSSRLASWTELGGKAAQRFAGTARYTLTFDAPAGGTEFLLSLGRVAQSARVRLNGRERGTLLMPPFQVRLSDVNPHGNLLEMEVTSVAANRIRDLDRRGVKWKNFHEINFVNINYQPFDASNWPLHDAGLLGPVTLQPLVAFTAPE